MPGKRKWIPKAEWLRQKEQEKKEETKKASSPLPAVYQHVLEQYMAAMKVGETPWWSRPWSTPIEGHAIQLGRARKAHQSWQKKLAETDVIASQWDQWSCALTQAAKQWIWPDSQYGGQTWDALGQIILEYAMLENQAEVQTALRISFQSTLTDQGGYARANAMLLSIASSQRTLKRNYWLTARQAHTEYKATIREGAKAIRIVYWEPPRCWQKECFAYKKQDKGPCEHSSRGHMTPKWWNVFNVDDIQDASGQLERDMTALDMQWIRLLPAPTTRKTMIETKLERMFDVITWNNRAMIPVKMIIGGSHRAFYYPSTKTITMPDKRLFQDRQVEYWLTVFHELTHAGDHALCTDKDTFMPHHADDRYAWGELIAEMGAGFLAAHFGLEVPEEVRKNGAAYLQGWAEKMDKDPTNSAKEIVWASTRSAKVVAFIIKNWLIE